MVKMEMHFAFVSVTTRSAPFHAFVSCDHPSFVSAFFRKAFGGTGFTVCLVALTTTPSLLKLCKRLVLLTQSAFLSSNHLAPF